MILPKNQLSLTIDSPFNGIIPHKIILFAINQSTLNGAYDKNPSYFTHANINTLQVTINGENLANLRCAFPHSTAQAYYNTIKALGLPNSSNLLTHANFKEGRTMFIFDTRSSNVEDAVNIEKSGSLRLSLSCQKPNDENIVIFILGYTLGIVQINADRRIFLNYLQ
jgi:hypothetical protein